MKAFLIILMMLVVVGCSPKQEKAKCTILNYIWLGFHNLVDGPTGGAGSGYFHAIDVEKFEKDRVKIKGVWIKGKIGWFGNTFEPLTISEFKEEYKRFYRIHKKDCNCPLQNTYCLDEPL